ncbi:outer membrane receptor protein involved in Fe transport [Dysgonomonas alginatilytica]|uniref:Outer membrane receptor protein involved in Fe transport n=1 Tax=Dysgonomonas alginatilytica TaxID=1605892 RepID=A0A2V3PRU9_9BACT|nr:TonB-dependent receptor [Dysgonomonas alginatilytica]PXV65532.1 outer membrane receptor protein involved in Fe transport [Dysgonomonas alginatilytica]
MRRKLLFLLFTILFSSVSAFSQNVIKGTVIDKDTKEALIGVSVYSEGAKLGTSTDLDGSFSLNVPSLQGKITFTYVGYNSLKLDARADLGTIELESSAIGLRDVVVTSSVAIRRKTPVAMSIIEPEMLEAKLSSQEFPEILKSTPGVYATKQGGGYGDSRINVRGFESANIAVMVNGVPVNDMEWGGVYWSNWAGLSDVTRSLQVQRGLGASKIAAPSVGGTINILTKSTDAQKGGSILYGIGNDGYNKVLFSLSTGLNKNGWAMSFVGGKNWGNGYILGSEFEAYTWYANISKIINANHQLSFTAFGSPQWHNQRYNNDKMLVTEWQQQKEKYQFNPTYGFDAQGQRVNANRNRYHKPQISLNHSWSINDKSSLSSALYLSIGDGAGNAWRGASTSSLYGTVTATGTLNGIGVNKTGHRNPLTGYMDYTNLQSDNAPSDVNTTGSKTVLTESRNNHIWTGLISTYTSQLTDEINFYGGIDLRYYAGLHDGRIIDLMGGSFYVDPARATIKDPTSTVDKNEKLIVGDIVYRDNTGYVVQTGGFTQAEYNKDALSVFISGSASNNTYWKIDRFYYSKENQKSEVKSFIGFNIKGGANYNINEEHNVFFNTGYVSRAPFMSGGYFTSIHTSNTVNRNAVNEKLFSAEVGYGYRSKFFTANLNVYYTKWMDRTSVRTFIGDDVDAFVNLSGLDARHQGIELDFVIKPIHNLEITGMASLGDWIWDSKTSGLVYDAYGRPSNGKTVIDAKDQKPITIDMRGVKVGNSAQTTFATGASYHLLDGLTIGADLTVLCNNYADYAIEIPDIGGTYTYYTPFKVPDVGLLDLRANYRFKMGPFDANLMGNVNNVLDQTYISDSRDLQPRNPGKHDDWTQVAVMYGFGRTYTTTLKVNF